MTVPAGGQPLLSCRLHALVARAIVSECNTHVQWRANIKFTKFYKLGLLFHGCIQEHKGLSPVPVVLQLLGALVSVSANFV